MSAEIDSSEEVRKPLFRDLNPDDPDPETTEIESLCVNCNKNGITKLLLTRVPFYKDLIMMSFSCNHCGFENNEVQSGGKVADLGVKYSLEVRNEKDLNRQVIKSDYTCVKIPDLEFEIPSQSQRGEVTTVEGIIERALTSLEEDQDLRRTEHPEVSKAIDDFLNRLKELKTLKSPFYMIFEDISGNLSVENPYMPQADPNCTSSVFVRSKEENARLGIYEEEKKGILPQDSDKETFTLEDLQSEVCSFQDNCPSCSSPCETNMKVTNIPYFKEVIIMASLCETCGYRTNEVKMSGGIEKQGLRIELKVDSTEDFNRDILKSETCSLSIPELDFEAQGPTLGGKFTTVEGMLKTIKDQLAENRVVMGDSQSIEESKDDLFEKFLAKFDRVLSGEMPVTLIMDDPAGNSYVQSFTPPDPDPGLNISRYERSDEQNDELGLNDMKTENYES